MPEPLLAALFGAIVAFGGTYLLQHGQFRRRDTEMVREHLGLVRAMRADLLMAKMTCKSSLERGLISPGTRFPVDLWISNGHKIVGVINRQAEEALIDIFGRMATVNGLLAATSASMRIEDDGAEEHLSSATVRLLIEKIDTGLGYLTALEGECEQRKNRLSHPIRDRLGRGEGIAGE